MAYTTLVRRRVTQLINSWGLSDFVLTEVQLRLRQVLPQDPSGLLVRARSPWDGMNYPFSMIDPENRFCEHQFWFLVLYHADEEHLIVASGAYRRIVGL